MPAFLNPVPCNRDLQQCVENPSGHLSADVSGSSGECLTLGLINNMPDGALEATERQFLALLNSASEGISIRLSLYSLPGVNRNELGSRHVSRYYSSAETLFDTHLDGLIVTGREPLMPDLRDEPYWESFARVLEWARDNTHSTVWSCLAAHAAALHMDGIGRIRSAHKHCGVFDCSRLSDHLLTTGTPSRFSLPHSRWNGLSEDALKSCGYEVLTRSADAGVDTFIKQDKSLFVFFQGHPEYESNALMLEYRRDVGRYLKGETDTYPSMPRSYFDQGTVTALTALQQQAKIRPQEEVLAEVSEVLERARIENTWSTTATSIYRNWLLYICEQKQLCLETSRAFRESHKTNAIFDSTRPSAAAKRLTSSAVFTNDF
jgi:homoserine O-succinyltransferase